MKQLLLLSILAAATLLPASCTNSSNAAAPASGNAATPASGNNGEGSFAFTIDGKVNVIKRPASSIFINEVSHNAAKGLVTIEVTLYPSAQLFKLVATDKGVTHLVDYQPSFGEEKAGATYLSSAAQNYYGKDVSISITTLDAAHVAGTFSGKFAGGDNKSVTVTDGSFDLPMKAK